MRTEIMLEEINLKEKLVRSFEENINSGIGPEPDFFAEIRKTAMDNFNQLGFPHTKMEEWRSTNLAKPLSLDYTLPFEPIREKIDVGSIFRCDIHQLDTHLLTLVNGWYVGEGEPLTYMPDGTIIGSFSAARNAHPEIFKKYYARSADFQRNGLNALNTAFAMDGVFIYVPDNVKVARTIQVVNIINLNENILIQPRNLVVMGKNSRLQLVHCDHSVQHKASFINWVTEAYLGEGADMDYYKLQNKDNESTLITTTYFEQQADSRLSSNVITLNGGMIRNNIHVNLVGRGSQSSLNGLFLVDKEQHVDNFLYVDHQLGDCESRQLYKGILDDQATGVFNGHVRVRKDAQHTNASQNSKNILLTDKASIRTQPHLEIYADDVKCSHGATIGQLDPEAMFYMRSRGIREDTSRMLLMYAFAAEVINKIRIEPLRHQIDEMVYKRLKGELSDCDQCILDCNARREINFEIDASKI